MFCSSLNSSYSDRRIANLDLYILKYEKYGREFPKKVNMSPDSFIQCALQFAYFKLYGKLVSTYESASTRRFRQGRVDNIRANSCETLEWVKSMQPDSETTVFILIFRNKIIFDSHFGLFENRKSKSLHCSKEQYSIKPT